jgi:hypothetical protein
MAQPYLTLKLEQKLVEIGKKFADTSWRPRQLPDLGGHCCLPCGFYRVTDAFGVEVNEGLLDAPTVAKLAEQIGLPVLSETTRIRRCRFARPITLLLDETFPLSYAEEETRLIELIRPGMSAWNMQSRLRRGSCKVEARSLSGDQRRRNVADGISVSRRRTCAVIYWSWPVESRQLDHVETQRLTASASKMKQPHQPSAVIPRSRGELFHPIQPRREWPSLATG